MNDTDPLREEAFIARLREINADKTMTASIRLMAHIGAIMTRYENVRCDCPRCKGGSVIACGMRRLSETQTLKQLQHFMPGCGPDSHRIPEPPPVEVAPTTHNMPGFA